MDTSMTFEHIKQVCCDIAARVRPRPGAGLSQLLHLAWREIKAASASLQTRTIISSRIM